MKLIPVVVTLLVALVRLAVARPAPLAGLASRAKTPFNIAVNWRFRHGVWQPTDDFVRGVTGINRYRFVIIDAVLFKYRFEYTTSKTYHYYFFDAEGDSYSANPFWTGDHWLAYNSNNPLIVRVSGE